MERHIPRTLVCRTVLCACALFLAAAPLPAADFVRGDADASGSRNITDGIFILNFLFLGGRRPVCDDAADADDSGGLNITDVVYILNFLFKGGPALPAPNLACGADATADGLGCGAFEPCAGSGENDVESALNKLGVDTPSTPRLTPDKRKDLPEDYGPLGGLVSTSGGDALIATDELFLIGIELPDRTGNLHVIEQLEAGVAADGKVNFGRTQVLRSLFPADNAWNEPSGRPPDEQRYDPRTLRAAAAGDLDGDGIEEIAVVYFDRLENVFLKVIDDKEAGFAEKVVTIAEGRKDVQDLELLAGDFDGDGTDELVAAVGGTLSADLLFLRGPSYEPDPSLTKNLPQELKGSLITLTLAAGNIDYDRAEELVVVKNENTDAHPPIGSARFTVYDDRTTGFARLETAPVGGMVPNFVSAVVADVSLGDVDGDGLDEIVFAGLAEFLGSSCDAVRSIMVALDDKEHLDPNGGFKRLAAAPGLVRYGCSAVSSVRLRYLHVNCGDFDGDRRSEIQIGQEIYEDFVQSAPFTKIHEIPDPEFNDENDQGGSYGEHTSVMLAADVTGDGRDDIINFTQWTRIPGDNSHGQISVWGIYGNDPRTIKLRQISRVVTNAYSKGDNLEPIIVAANVDKDTAILRLKEHRFLFTAPLVIAALAGPPCHGDEAVKQNIAACSTTYGKAKSVGGDETKVVSFTASASVGYSAESKLFNSGIEIKGTFSRATSSIDTSAYTLTKEIAYTTGEGKDEKGEDIVVFTCLPVDQYVYEIIFHDVPELIGTEVIVNVPREPILTSAERGYYNATVPEGSLKIGDNVFQHTLGEVASYPNVEAKKKLIEVNKGDSNLQAGPYAVGQGTGFTTAEIAVSTEHSKGESLDLSYEFSVETTVLGIKLGGTAGWAEGSTFTVTSGSKTTYAGSVGNINGDNFPADTYSWGMFTYVQRDLESMQKFEVINYWVE